MSITQKEIKKHINECKALLAGTFHKIAYNRQWDIVVHFCWESDSSVDMQWQLVRKDGNLKYIIFNEMLTADFVYDNEAKIEKKITSSKKYKDFHKRIKDECDWASAYDKSKGHRGAWEEDVLLEAENTVVYHYES